MRRNRSRCCSYIVYTKRQGALVNLDRVAAAGVEDRAAAEWWVRRQVIDVRDAVSQPQTMNDVEGAEQWEEKVTE